MGKKNKIGTWLIIIAIIIGVLGFTLTYLTVNIPADINYNRAFGSDVTLAYSAGSLQSTQFYVDKIYADMLVAFPNTASYSTLYGSGYYWGYIPENTMAYEQQYLLSINQTLTNNIAQAATLENSTSIGTITPYILLNQTRSEMHANGGLDWVIQPAWYLKNAPFAYWSWIIYVVLIIIIAIMLILGFIMKMAHDDY